MPPTAEPNRLPRRCRCAQASARSGRRCDGSDYSSLHDHCFMIILGLNAFQGDSAAAILRDGVLIAAAEEERFRRIKHWAGFPSEAVAYCLREANLRLNDVDHIAVNQDSKVHRLRKIAYLLTNLPTLELVKERLRMRGEREGVSELLAKAFPGQNFSGTIHNIEHHFAHLSSA